MQYKCEKCQHIFEFDDHINFCPYCGKTFEETATEQEIRPVPTILVQTIDSIWGDSARLKDEFSSVISKCIDIVNDYAKSSVEKILPNHNLSEYNKNYSLIKQSSNRKVLITRIDSFLNSLESIIYNLNDRVSADRLKALENDIHDVDDMKKEIYDFVGLRYIPSDVDVFSRADYSAVVKYSRDQLSALYNMVLIAYSKYKKCVEDNNMFAAFASTSNYGMLTDYWRHYLYDVSRIGEEDSDEESIHYDQVIEHMKIINSEQYLGKLDEDFVPHVDAFWYGLKMLSEFVDNHIVIKCNVKAFYMDDIERSKLLRIVVAKDFEVNESRLDNSIEIKERFERKLKVLRISTGKNNP